MSIPDADVESYSAPDMLSREISLPADRRPWRHIGLVERIWLQEQGQTNFKQRFLVLDGPAQLGKTTYAMDIKGALRTLSVQCNPYDLNLPSLQEFERSRHQAIVFNDAPCRLVLRHKPIFLAVPRTLHLPGSMSSWGYDINLSRISIIICTTNWAQEYHQLAPEDQLWFNENSVYVSVTRPLWCES